MANIKIDGKTVPAKKTTVRNPLMLDEKYTGSEPLWDTESACKLSDFEFDHLLRQSFFYYNYFYSARDLKKNVVAWMTASKEYSKEQIRAVERAGDRVMPMTVFSLITAHRRGMPWRGRHLEYIKSHISRAIRSGAGQNDPAVKVKVHVPTIQDRLDEKTRGQLGELEHEFDLVVKSKTEFNAYQWFTDNKVPQSQLSKFESVFSGHRREIAAAAAKEDDQLVEGYRHLKSADFKRILAWLDQLASDLDQYRGTKRAVKKQRAPRAVSKEKIVSKFKFAKENKELKLVSINPADIIGAKTLWIYDVRKRKLGVYHADEHLGPLTIKGTSVVGFDPSKSIYKTLRKPSETLREFAKATKAQLRKFIAEIKTAAVEMNGRGNADLILLRVD